MPAIGKWAQLFVLWIMENSILEQIEHAFTKKPELDGTLHGVRRIVQGKHGSRSSLFFSRKNRALMPVESRLERAVCYQLEWDTAVARYRTQAFRIPFGKSFIYPDICVKDVNGHIRVIEVKPADFVHSNRNNMRFNFLKHALAEENIGLSIFGWAECKHQIWRENVQRIYDRGGRAECDIAQLKTFIEQALAGKEKSTYGELQIALTCLAAPPHILEASVFYRILLCELDRPMTRSTVLRVAK